MPINFVGRFTTKQSKKRLLQEMVKLEIEFTQWSQLKLILRPLILQHGFNSGSVVREFYSGFMEWMVYEWLTPQ